jgi:hypothetical protein
MANVPRSPILVTLVMEAIRSSETSVLTRATPRNTPEDGIRHSHSRGNLKAYKAQKIMFVGLTMWQTKAYEPVVVIPHDLSLAKCRASQRGSDSYNVVL